MRLGDRRSRPPQPDSLEAIVEPEGCFRRAQEQGSRVSKLTSHFVQSLRDALPAGETIRLQWTLRVVRLLSSRPNGRSR